MRIARTPWKRRLWRALSIANVTLALLLVAAPAAVSGTERSTALNRLAGETSPFLQQHADNPVDWHPWGDAALAKARTENKPIFLSIGYSTCYWCHVMEREVFSDPETAALLNAHFVPIMVDNEERPDLDRIYMPVRLLTGGDTGWPLSVFLTPDLKPFLAAGYIPNLKFRKILEILRKGWAEDEARYRGHAKLIVRLMAREHALLGKAAAEGLPKRGLVDQAAKLFRGDFDPVNGGFEAPPRFPRPAILEMLMALHERGDQSAWTMVATTLDGMARGAIHDQLGGGFHRYAEDRRWLEPHFEKMLFDNAMLLRAYARAHASSGRKDYRRVAAGIADFVAREMTDPRGLFFAALDSETDGVEGAFYLWRRDELRDALTAAEFAVAAALYGIGGQYRRNM